MGSNIYQISIKQSKSIGLPIEDSWKIAVYFPQIVLIRDVAPECIKARIDFPKGLHPFHPKYEYPLPLEWSLERFIESLGNYESRHIDPILKEYLEKS